MTIIEAAVSAGSVIGGVSSSYVLRAVGNVYLLLISTLLFVIAYIFTNVCLKESLANAVPVSCNHLSFLFKGEKPLIKM